MNLLHRLFAFFHVSRLDREMDEEMRAHLERETAQNIARGMSPDEARWAARRAFGGLDQLKERERDARGWRWLDDTLREVRFAARQLAKSPGFTTVALVSLALGIGANTAVFSLINGILLGSLPVPNPHELRTIQWSGLDARIENVTGNFRFMGGGGGHGRSSGAMGFATSAGERALADAFTYPTFRTLRELCAAEAELAGYSEIHSVNVRARREPFVADGLLVSDNFFPALGLQPLLGRMFVAGDGEPGAEPLIVISHDWWEQQFDLDLEVIGQSVSLNGHAFIVAGVLPRGFHGVGLADRIEFYVTPSAQPQLMPGWPLTSPGHWWVHLIARVRPGVSATRLQAALDARFAPQVDGVMGDPRIVIGDGRAGPAYDQRFYQKPLAILLAVVAVVLLVACSNLAGLSLARGATRQHEFSVRAALGSGRWRLMRQSLVESMLLTLGGAGLGLLISFWVRDALAVLLTGSDAGLRYDTSLDLRVLAFAFVVGLLATLVAGFLPAWRAGRVDPAAGLKSSSALIAPRLRAGRMLAVGQIALTLLLVAGAGLYIRTVRNLIEINPGFATGDLLLFRLNARSAGLKGAELVSFYDAVLDALEKIPGRRSVALMHNKLLAGGMSGGGFFTLPAHPEFTGREPRAHRLCVDERFFATMGIPLLAGRGFTAADSGAAPKVVVVNEAFARKYFANENPLGQILKSRGSPEIDWTIVGVCRDAKYESIRTDPPSTVYFSFRQDAPGSAHFAVRSSLAPLSLVPAVRRLVGAINPDVPVAEATTQDIVRDSKISQERLFATLVSALAGLALLLSMIGVYGLMAYNVACRTAEIGVRVALGATRRRIAGPILREALLISAAGLVIGVPTALAAARIVRSQLYGVAPTDPPTYLAGSVLLVGVAVLAAWMPARRAARVDPLTALRSE